MKGLLRRSNRLKIEIGQHFRKLDDPHRDWVVRSFKTFDCPYPHVELRAADDPTLIRTWALTALLNVENFRRVEYGAKPVVAPRAKVKPASISPRPRALRTYRRHRVVAANGERTGVGRLGLH